MPDINPTIEPAAKRLCRIAPKITDDVWAQGAAWYPQEAAWIAGQAETYGVPARTAIAVFAALSPRERYGRNRRLMIRTLKNGHLDCCTLPENVKRANRVMKCGPTALTGPKVRSFDANLAGCTQSVTVDVWISRVMGIPQPGTVKRYEAAAQAVRRAAGRIGVEPRTLQAALWFHVRGDKPQDDYEES